MAEIVRALARVCNSAGSISSPHLLPDEPVDELCRALGVTFRDRLLTPLATVRLFVLQILCGNTAITHLRQLSGLEFAPSSYCEARLRLPLRLLRCLLSWTIEQAQGPGNRAIGPRVLIVDGSSFSMSDTTSLRRCFGLPKGRRVVEGVAYPLAKFIGLIDLASGLFVDGLCGTLYRHDMGLVSRLHPTLQAGDILLGDRAFCSFAHVALLNGRGVRGCFRLHQRRKVQAGGKRQRWMKPAVCPAWLDPRAFALMPAWIDVRIVGYGCPRRGYRTKVIHVATTLPDDAVWTDRKVAEMYGHRWRIETCFDHLKTTMKGSVLKCQTVGGIAREQLTYLLAYNLVRLSMLKWALSHGVSVWRVSFIDAMRQSSVRLTGLPGVDNLLLVPERPGRNEPRVIRRRMKEYDLLTGSREARKAREKHG